MDTNTLIAEAKARFNHNSAKDYLKEKYNAKLILADQGGLWKADAATINLLTAFENDFIVLIDTFENPVRVERKALLKRLQDVYRATMEQWYIESQELENKR